MTGRVRRAARAVCREDGIALISAVGILGVLSALGASVVFYSNANFRAAAYASDERVALHGAEAGVNHAVAILAGAADASKPSALPPGTFELQGESVSYSGVLEGDVWTVTATSSVRNPTGAADIEHTVGTKVRVSYDVSASENGAWNYVFSDDPTTCMTVPNSVTIAAPLFIRGSLCLQNTATVTGAPLKVGGSVTLENSSAIGGPGTARLTDVKIAGGCRTKASDPFGPCGDAQRVYVNPPGVETDVEELVKPPIDLHRWYGEARPGPLGECTEGSFPGGFDTNASATRNADGTYPTLDRSLPAPVDLTPPAAYDCVFRDGAHTLGRIAWTGGTNGTLTVLGTIFFDGDIVMTNNAQGVYEGRGTIYASGRIELGNSTTLCAVAGCDRDAWDPNEDLLLFVAGSETDADGFYIHNSAKLQGAAYVVTDYREQNFVDMQGPVIARQLYYSNNTEAVKWVPIWAMLTGAPSTSTATKITHVTGSWVG